MIKSLNGRLKWPESLKRWTTKGHYTWKEANFTSHGNAFLDITIGMASHQENKMVDEDEDKKTLAYYWEKLRWSSHHGLQHWGFSEAYNMTQLHPPTPKPVSKYITKILHSTVYFIALGSTAKLWNHPRCPSTEEWIKKIPFIYTMEFV